MSTKHYAEDLAEQQDALKEVLEEIAFIAGELEHDMKSDKSLKSTVVQLFECHSDLLEVKVYLGKLVEALRK